MARLRQALRRAFPSTLPVLAGYIFLGIAYGVTMRASGFGAAWSLLISAAVYAGSMQFALIGLLSGSFAPVTVALMTLLVNARHIFYGLSMLKPYAAVRGKPYLIFALTDETYSLVCSGAPDDLDSSSWYAAISGLNHLYWMTGAVIGGLLGQVIPFDLTGIDFAMTALFTVIVTEQTLDAVASVKAGKVKIWEAAFPSLLGFLSTLLCLLTLGTSSFLVGAMLLMMACFFVRFQAEERRRGA